jgi:hypothetical protein
MLNLCLCLPENLCDMENVNHTVIIAGNVLEERGVCHKAASSACKELIAAALRIQIEVV